MTAERYPEKFENASGSVTTSFPVNLLEADEQQAYRSGMSDVLSGDYAHRYYGMAPAPKAVRKIAVRFVISGSATPAAADAAADAIIAACRKAGLGKLYSIDSTGDRRWCWAEIDARPGMTVKGMGWKHKEVSLAFTGFSDWFSTALSTFTTDVTAGQSPKTVTWTNPGNAPMALDITAQALASGGYSAGFTILNSNNGMQVATSRVSTSTSSQVRIRRSRQQVQYSTDAGSSWTDDYASVTIPATQVPFGIELDDIVLANSIVITVGGTPNVRVTATGYATWH